MPTSAPWKMVRIRRKASYDCRAFLRGDVGIAPYKSLITKIQKQEQQSILLFLFTVL